MQSVSKISSNCTMQCKSFLHIDNNNSFNTFVNEIERKNKEFHYRTSIKNSKSKLIDYFTPELCTKLAKYIDVKSITALQSNNNTDVEVVTSSNIIENDDGNGNDFQYNAKENERINDKSREYSDADTRSTTNPRKSADQQRSWVANYLRKPKNDRIMWESKLYKLERSYSAKSLPDKTEELMDLAAGDFADWLKSLGSDGKVNMSKDLIKKLFSIGIEDDAAKKALFVAPVIKSAIPEEIANIVRLPDLAIEKKVDRILLEDKKLMKIQPKYVAFGRTLPPSLKLTKFEIEDRINKPNFPDNLRTNQVVFDGITHLRSTKILEHFLDEHPEIPKPTFLIKSKMRKQSTITNGYTNKSNYTPLYKIANKSKIA